MLGAGRLSRSDRPQGPQTDLRLAARGAAILLREQLAPLARFLSQPRARKAAIREQNSNRFIAAFERYVPRRVGIAATVLMLLGSVALGVVNGGHVEELTEFLSDTRNAAANAAGFRIASVTLNGRKQLTQDEILAIGGVNGRSSLLFLDAATVRDRLKANPWIADANVLKLYPDRLQIDVTERTAFALWQQDGRLAVVAADGAVLENYVSKRFTTLPLVVGKGADTRARDFLALLDRYPQVRAVTRAAILVGERRWNLRLTDGLDVRLPENDVGNALAMLSQLDKEDHLFSKDIVAIDMRLSDRLTVRLSEDAAKARDELFAKENKTKKKAGAA
ncbi:FtsQ-type POTRA domain-containing protein [Tardiphaga sp. vice352]|uniref:cell division protein FtsQ/DivIB n=1 Tax=unclassified Tardiphaga TaxID=2631404 RepID=UPI00116264A9|nr:MULTISPECIES: cell division protein FtsQ/DivIB [unclassified Tardiphaga]MBC7585827.1 FtsQ-type POTRA domain-containing protein [Tardiphaga sp.]QDM16292.1 FtsQ-type POTRA domain-containing protein [Tardiphaga sp. vice278]QDM21316.1 FtsQ-type POTRA domain-containing protein [Tardiphaga sp. vice154]QDM26501.1 FtsQ-type POTRA domain-containing protein [Tardiphaga sp. vice304]QDM31567.1 FtsQ-type POTRA domain-containing protein [Tardiphaga sp. vice352]